MEFQARVRASKPGFRIGLRMVSNRGLDLCFKPLFGCQTSVLIFKVRFQAWQSVSETGSEIWFEANVRVSNEGFSVRVRVSNWRSGSKYE